MFVHINMLIKPSVCSSICLCYKLNCLKAQIKKIFENIYTCMYLYLLRANTFSSIRTADLHSKIQTTSESIWNVAHTPVPPFLKLELCGVSALYNKKYGFSASLHMAQNQKLQYYTKLALQLRLQFKLYN